MKWIGIRTWTGWCLAGTLVAAGCSDRPASTGVEALEADGAMEELSDADVLAAGGGIPFSDLAIFLEMNASDHDLGVQVFLDAEDWEWIRAFDPSGKRVLHIGAGSSLRRLGITELRFESAEPSPEEVLDLFEMGEYRFVGRTTEGDRLWGTATLSHALPPAPSISTGEGEITDPDNTVVTWDGIPGLAGYEVIVANEGTGASLEVRLDADAESFHVPPEFLEGGGEYKAEVLSIALNGNKVITEATFFTAP